MVLASAILSLLIIYSCLNNNVDGKIYQRCELARELRNFDVPDHELPTWVCIAKHESNFDTGAMNLGSGDHGLFQISEIYWCSPPGYGCNSPCSKFRDEDIADDLQCVRRIHTEHTRLTGDGFNAWVVYPLFCQNVTYDFIQDCFDEYNSTENEISTDEDVDDDGYSFPALPHKEDEDGDGYEFPKLPTREEKALLPFSKTSINDFVAIHKKNPWSKSTSEKSTTQYKFPKFPASKGSIHHSVPVHKPKHDFHKFPGPKGSIHDSISIEDRLRNDIIKANPFLRGEISLSKAPKGSIDDSITVGQHLSKTISDNIKTNPFFNGKLSISKAAVHDSLSASRLKSLESNPFLNLKFPVSSTDNEIETSTTPADLIFAKNPFLKPKSTKKEPNEAGNPFLTTSKPQMPTTTTSKPSSVFKSSTKSLVSTSSERPTFTTTYKSPTTIFTSQTTISQYYKTLKPQIANRGSFSVDSRPFDSSTTRAIRTTSKPSTVTIRTSIATIKPYTATIKPFTTTIKPFTTTIKPFTTTIKPFTTTIKPFTKTIKPYTTKPFTSSTRIYTFATFSATSSKPSTATSKPSTATSKSSTVTSKPSTATSKSSTATSKPSTATIKTIFAKSSTSNVFHSQTTSGKTQFPTTKTHTATSNSQFTTPKRTSSKPFSYLSTTSSVPDLEGASSSFKPLVAYPTTIRPMGRQVTFAPDSWFSWIFNSQTLPPLVAPPRPGSRPTNEGPPRPPGAPDFSTTRRPLPRPTHLQPAGGFLNSSTTRRPLPRPTHLQPLGGFDNSSTTRRPLPRPTHLQPISYAPAVVALPGHQQPINNAPVALPGGLGHPQPITLPVGLITTRRPFPRPPHLQNTDVGGFTRRPLPMRLHHPPRRPHPGYYRNAEDAAVDEVQVDEHVVYLRSKYGFQLFRV